MQEDLYSDIASVLAPILLFLTLVNVAMVLTTNRFEHVPREDNRDEGPKRFIYPVIQSTHACQAKRLVAQQQEDIQRLSARVAELCEWIGQLTSMMRTNERVAERLLSMSMQQSRGIEMLKHRLGRTEDILGALVQRERRQEEEQKERAKRERAEKRQCGIWEIQGRRLRRVGREKDLRAGKYQEGAEAEDGSDGDISFKLVERNSGDVGSLSRQEMNELQVLQ